MLAEKNCHIRDKNITIGEKSYMYSIKGYEGERFKSATRLVHSLFPEFETDKIIENIFKKNPLPEKYRGYTPETLKAKWEENRKESADLGTLLHDSIERFYNGENINNETAEWNQFIQFYNDHKHLKPYRTEWMVYDEDVKYLGIIDMVYENDDGTLSIYDWKRCKSIDKANSFNKWGVDKLVEDLPDANFWHYSFQLNIYKSILERKYKKKIKELFLVAMHPDKKQYSKIACQDLSEKTERLFELRELEIKN